MCGEKKKGGSPEKSGLGSPPRVRGKVYGLRTKNETARITPACAGKSCTAGGAAAPPRDHPRVCGEKVRHDESCSEWQGSPPRVRGKGISVSSETTSARITPACAGKSAILCFSWLRCWDHPRVCGEKRLLVSLPCLRLRITPACAGKRLKRSHSIGHFSYILCLFHSVLHRASVSGGSRAGPCAPPCLPAQNAVPV